MGQNTISKPAATTASTRLSLEQISQLSREKIREMSGDQVKRAFGRTLDTALEQSTPLTMEKQDYLEKFAKDVVNKLFLELKDKTGPEFADALDGVKLDFDDLALRIIEASPTDRPSDELLKTWQIFALARNSALAMGVDKSDKPKLDLVNTQMMAQEMEIQIYGALARGGVLKGMSKTKILDTARTIVRIAKANISSQQDPGLRRELAGEYLKLFTPKTAGAFPSEFPSELKVMFDDAADFCRNPPAGDSFESGR